MTTTLNILPAAQASSTRWPWIMLFSCTLLFLRLAGRHCVDLPAARNKLGVDVSRGVVAADGDADQHRLPDLVEQVVATRRTRLARARRSWCGRKAR